MYNNYLYIKPLQLADMLFDSTFLSLFPVAFCPQYVILEADLMSEEGHFLPLEWGVKYLPNPLIFASYHLKRQKMRIFASFPLLFSVVRILYIHLYKYSF